MLAHPHAPWTDLTLILDRSGSIADIRESLLAGINQFLAGQAKEAGHTRISLIRFDDQFETVWDRIPLSGATFLHSQDLVPRGRTALYDAIGLTLERTQEHLASSTRPTARTGSSWPSSPTGTRTRAVSSPMTPCRN